MARPRRPGFTLLEVVLAVALGVGLLAAMFGFYRHATRVQAAVADEVQRVAAVRAVMRLLTREVRSAFVFRFLGQGVEGSQDQIRFATTRLPSDAVWIEQSATDTNPRPPQRDLMIVGYRLRYVENEEGDLVVAGLERSCQRLLTPREAEEGEEIELTLLTPRIRFIRLRYWDGSGWVESWSGGDLPAAVEIVLGHKPLPEEVEPVDYPYKTHRRVVAVPSAARPAQAAVLRGLEDD